MHVSTVTVPKCSGGAQVECSRNTVFQRTSIGVLAPLCQDADPCATTGIKGYCFFPAPLCQDPDRAKAPIRAKTPIRAKAEIYHQTGKKLKKSVLLTNPCCRCCTRYCWVLINSERCRLSGGGRRWSVPRTEGHHANDRFMPRLSSTTAYSYLEVSESSLRIARHVFLLVG